MVALYFFFQTELMVKADGENVTLTDLMGIRKVIPGKLKKVDLMSNVILIEAC